MRLKNRYLIVELILERDIHRQGRSEMAEITTTDIYQWCVAGCIGQATSNKPLVGSVYCRELDNILGILVSVFVTGR